LEVKKERWLCANWSTYWECYRLL